MGVSSVFVGLWTKTVCLKTCPRFISSKSIPLCSKSAGGSARPVLRSPALKICIPICPSRTILPKQASAQCHTLIANRQPQKSCATVSSSSSAEKRHIPSRDKLCGNSPVATFASCRTYANKCIFRKGRCPLSSIPIRSLYASLQARIGTADNRILILFFAEKYIFICVCAIFVVPLHANCKLGLR